MDIKEYIDHFPEIAQRERHQQFTLLEQARESAFTQETLRAYTLYSWFLPWVWIVGIGAVLFLIKGYTLWLPIAALIPGLIISRIMINNRRESLMRRGLKAVLAQEKAK